MDFLSLGVPVVMLVVAYVTGTTLERRHLLSLRAREEVRDDMAIITYDAILPHWNVEEVHLVIGSTVVSVDYFKRIAGGLRAIVGGRIRAFEPMMERGRREAVLRMKARAVEMGYQHVINVRLETAQLSGMRSDGKGTAGIEVVAYGTALKLRS